MKIRTILNTAKTVAGQKAPEIYVGIGIGLSILTSIIAAKETPKAIRLIEEIEIIESREATFKEKTCIFVKSYWPAICTGVVSVALIIGGQHIQSKRTAAAATAYILAQDSLKNFTAKVVDEIGEKRVTQIKDDIVKDKLSKEIFDESVVIRTSGGDTLCYDVISGRYFYSSAETIRKAENEMNKRMMRENFVSLNEFYIELDLDPIKFGDELGWDIGLEGCVDIEYSSQLNPDNIPALVIDSDICPRWHLYQ